MGQFFTRSFVPLVVALTAAPVFAAPKMERNSFLLWPAPNHAALMSELNNPTVMLHYEEHFHRDRKGVLLLMNSLQLKPLSQTHTFTMYAVTPWGTFHHHPATLHRGDLVWASPYGTPILREACGNPLVGPMPLPAKPKPARATPPKKAATPPPPKAETVVTPPPAVPAAPPAAPTVNPIVPSTPISVLPPAAPPVLEATPAVPMPMATIEVPTPSLSFPIGLIALPVAGVVALSNSGHSHPAPAPEPAPFVALAVGGAFLLVKQRRR